MIYRISSLNISDISQDAQFFVDTNVLLMIHYGANVSNVNLPKKAAYSGFINALLNKRNVSLSVSVLNMQEMFHVIENTEFLKKKALNSSFSNKKAFRRDSDERNKVHKILSSVMGQMKQFYRFVSEEINDADVAAFLNNYCSHKYDPIDYFVVENNCSNCENFITDDGDFQTDGRLNVYTF